MNSFYPETYLPDTLKEFSKNWISILENELSPKMPIKPLEPILPTKIKLDLFVAIVTYIFPAIFIYVLSRKFQIVLNVFVIWIFIYITYFMYNWYRYKNAIINYERDMVDFKNNLVKFDNMLISIENEKHKIGELFKDSKWIEKKRLEYTNQLIKPIKKAEVEYENKDRGMSEAGFEYHLKIFFPNEIITNRVTEIFSYYDFSHNNEDVDDFEDYKSTKSNNAYIPDFVFEHSSSNMIIDIEIDEPYSNNGIPIHTISNLNDKKRNEYFNSLNWLIIRFSEKQIILNPLSCCLEIALLIMDYTGDTSYYKKLKDNPRIFRDIKWNRSQAAELALKKYRKNYTRDEYYFDDLKLNSIEGKWQSNGKLYEISKDNTIIEKYLSTNENEITDRGLFRIKFNICGRLVLSVKWSKNQTKYLLDPYQKDKIILTDLFTREQILFEPYNTQ